MFRDQPWVGGRRPAARGFSALTSCPIVFVVRHQFSPDHHNTATLFQTGEINAAEVSGRQCDSDDRLRSRGRDNQTLLEVPQGVARDIEVSFDGQPNPVLHAA